MVWETCLKVLRSDSHTESQRCICEMLVWCPTSCTTIWENIPYRIWLSFVSSFFKYYNLLCSNTYNGDKVLQTYHSHSGLTLSCQQQKENMTKTFIIHDTMPHFIYSNWIIINQKWQLPHDSPESWVEVMSEEKCRNVSKTLSLSWMIFNPQSTVQPD